MKKFFFVFRRSLVINNHSLIGQLLHCVLIFAFVVLPCFAYPAFFDRWGKVHESIIQDPYSFQTCVPCFEYIRFGTVPINVIPQNHKLIGKGSPGGSITTVPIYYDSSKKTNNRTDNTREDYYIWAHPFLVLLELALGALMGLFIGVFISLVLFGQLDLILSIGLLRKLKVPKCFYHGPDWYR